MKCLFSLFFVLSVIGANAQQNKKFQITGSTNFYKNQELFVQGGASKLFSDLEFDQPDTNAALRPIAKQVPTETGSFKLSGTVKYPHPFQFSAWDTTEGIVYGSYSFFLDGGDKVVVNIDNLKDHKKVDIQIRSKSNAEYQHLKKLWSHSVDTLTGAIHDMQEKQKVLQRYIRQHPNSYVALWALVDDFVYIYFRYRDSAACKESVLSNTRLFSPKIKETKTYKELVKGINEILGERLPVEEGLLFPDIPLGSLGNLYATVHQNKFILIDFWFSHCSACVAQFPALKNVYDKYKQAGFEIVGISIDEQEDIEDWKKVIQERQLNWRQYLDTNGVETKKLRVDFYPTTLLLDNSGKIIRKDITPDELAIFLEEYCSKKVDDTKPLDLLNENKLTPKELKK
jgi:thiol-disulfide isomerase/thioredoxin